MTGDAKFAELYKNLLNGNFRPDSRRSEAALAALLRRLSGQGPPEKTESGVENSRRT